MVEEVYCDYLCIASRGRVHLTHVRCHSLGSAPLSNVTEEEAALSSTSGLGEGLSLRSGFPVTKTGSNP